MLLSLEQIIPSSLCVVQVPTQQLRPLPHEFSADTEVQLEFPFPFP